MPPNPGLSDSTLRQVVHVSIGGSRLRIRISNAFGDEPLSILSVHVAVSLGLSRISVPSDKAVTFNGRGSVIVPAGAPIESDPVTFPLAPLSNLAITMHLAYSSSAVTAHPGSRETSYLQAGDEVSASELPSAVQAVHWYFVNGVDVAGSAASTSVVTLGDSITDGRGSTTDGNNRWPDQLARRLQADRKTADIAVLNEGIGGNRLLHDGLGPNALARFDRDVLAQTGVRWLIVLEGINDIGTASSSAEDIIGAYEQLIFRAHAHGIRVYGATILPYEGAAYFSPSGEAIRQKVNAWIRNSGKFDAVIDWDKGHCHGEQM
jgi:lysophospholipase L1-like esterase